MEALSCKKYNEQQTQKWRDACEKSKKANPIDWIHMIPQLAFYVFNKNYGYVAHEGNTALWAKTKKEVIKDFEQQYLSYPITGVYEPINHYCDNCDNEFSSGEIKVDLVVTIKESR